MRRILNQISKVWRDTALAIDTDLTNEEIERRLSGERFRTGNMQILVRRRSRAPRFVILAQRRGRSNGLQRFLYCEVAAAEQGSVLKGVIRTRPGVNWFINAALAFFAFLSIVTLMAATAKLVQGSPQEAFGLVVLFLLIALMATVYLAMAYVSMAATESNEQYLAEWLRQRLS